MAVAVVPQSGLLVLQVLDVPVVLVQRVVHERLVAEHHARAQHEVRRHEQRVRPALLREVVLVGDGVLQHVVAKAQRAMAQVIELAQCDVPVLFVAGDLIQREHRVAHGAGVHRPAGQAKLDVFVHARLEEIEVFPVAGDAVGLADAQIRDAAGPVPHHIHVHGLADNRVDCTQHAVPVKGDVRHGDSS